MTDMPERAAKTDIPKRIFAICYRGSRTSGQWVSDQSAGSALAEEYVRADLVAAKDAEIVRLRKLLKRRQIAPHTHNCGGHMQGLEWQCDCGHADAAAYFREIEG